MNDTHHLIEAALALALTPTDLKKLKDLIDQEPSKVHALGLFSAERQVVVIGLTFAGKLSNWVMTPSPDPETADAMLVAWAPMLARCAEDQGHFDAADTIKRARKAH